MFKPHNARQLAQALFVSGCVLASSAVLAGPFSFSTGIPDGKIGTASRPASIGKIEIESADDFVLSQTTSINQISFIGLLPVGATIDQVRAEIYRVFPKDSTNPPSGSVPTRANSPSDVAFAERDNTTGLAFTTTNLGSFTVANSVINGIHPIPNQTTGGEGAVSGNEIEFDVTLADPFLLAADHYFFIPQVEVTGGEFLWLSAPKPIVVPGTAFTPDLQSWIRDEALAPDWLRIGTDIVGPPATGGPAPTFNSVFSLQGETVPEPGSIALLGAALGGIGLIRLHRRR
jgi:hypothetical protein